MSSKEFIESKLVNRTNARFCDTRVENNRYHYRLMFDESIGWDWFERQVDKASGETGHLLEPYKFGLEDGFMFAEVWEVERREGIDDNQKSLDDITGVS